MGASKWRHLDATTSAPCASVAPTVWMGASIRVCLYESICSKIVIMKSIKQTVADLFQNESIRSEIKDILKPFGVIIYNEVYFYLLMILVYCGILFVAVLCGLYYMLGINRQLNMILEKKEYLDML
jgi:hypothetical protein